MITTLIAAIAASHFDLTASVTVTNEVSAKVGGADVYLVGPIGSKFHMEKATTSPTGVALLNVISPGDYYVVATKSNQAHTITRASIRTNSGTVNLNANLKKLSQISINFFILNDDNCQPISGFVGLTISTLGQMQTTKTNQNGVATFAGAEPFKSSTIGLFNGHAQFADTYERYDAIGKELKEYVFVKSAGLRPYKWTIKEANPSTSKRAPGQTITSPVKLEGMVRQATRDRIVVGTATTVSVNLLYSGWSTKSINSRAIVTISGPDGANVMSEDYTSVLLLNTYAEKKVTFTPRTAGKYTVTVSADGDGSSHWDGTYSFTVNAK